MRRRGRRETEAEGGMRSRKVEREVEVEDENEKVRRGEGGKFINIRAI
jgi:hypothetical protein